MCGSETARVRQPAPATAQTGGAARAKQTDWGKGMVWRLIKAVLVLTIFAALGLIAYAYIGPIFFAEDFAPPVEQVTKPVTLEVD